MDWLQKLSAILLRRSPASAQRNVDRIERSLAQLRAKVRALPNEQQSAFAQDIHSLIEEQARAHQTLNDALDDRYER